MPPPPKPTQEQIRQALSLLHEEMQAERKSHLKAMDRLKNKVRVVQHLCGHAAIEDRGGGLVVCLDCGAFVPGGKPE